MNGGPMDFIKGLKDRTVFIVGSRKNAGKTTFLHLLAGILAADSGTIQYTVGTGEANNRQSSSWGDGVYKSEDGGRTFRNVGLKASEHIARIVVDPRDSNVVYVAAPGPLWKGGGERGHCNQRRQNSQRCDSSLLEHGPPLRFNVHNVDFAQVAA